MKVNLNQSNVIVPRGTTFVRTDLGNGQYLSTDIAMLSAKQIREFHKTCADDMIKRAKARKVRLYDGKA